MMPTDELEEVDMVIQVWTSTLKYFYIRLCSEWLENKRMGVLELSGQYGPQPTETC